MKKLVLGFAAVCMITFASMAQSSSDQGLIGRAKGAAHECLQNAPTTWEINGYAETLGICFVDGFITRVTLAASFRCHTEVCPKIADRIIATVDFGCDGEIIGVTCY